MAFPDPVGGEAGFLEMSVDVAGEGKGTARQGGGNGAQAAAGLFMAAWLELDSGGLVKYS